MSCENTPISKNATYSLRQKNMTLSQSFTQSVNLPLLPTAREGYVFRSVCQSFCPPGGGLHSGDLYLGGLHPGVSASRVVCIQGDLSTEGYASRGYASRKSASGGSDQPSHTDIQWRPLHRVVRILLECFLVSTGIRCRVVFQLCDMNNSTWFGSVQFQLSGKLPEH